MPANFCRGIPRLALLYHSYGIMNQPTSIGLIASILTTLAAVPQLIKICKDKKAENISLMWVVILFLGLCGWIYYGILKKDIIILVSNLVAALINAGIAVSAIWFKQKKPQA
jgi:MtN3 and saliva related transmembrane protein